MKVLTIWIIITEGPDINMIVKFTKRVIYIFSQA